MAIIKILIGGIMIWLVTELGKKSGSVGGLILSLPVTSIIALAWLWFETKDPAQVALVSKETLIFVLPSLTFFIVLWLLLLKGIHFYTSFIVSIALTACLYAMFFKLRNQL